MAAALIAAGLPCVAIDWSGNRHKAKAPVRQIDLTTGEGQALLEEVLAQPALKFGRFAPPCRTFSSGSQALGRARGASA